MRTSEPDFQSFVASVGCSNATDVMFCLRQQDLEKIQAWNNASIATPEGTFRQGPVIDGVIWKDTLYNLYRKGKILDVPAIIGNDANEGSKFSPNLSTKAEFQDFFENHIGYSNLTDTQVEKILEAYPVMPQITTHGAYFPSISQLLADFVFLCPAYNMLESWAKYDSPSRAWNYRYAVLDELATEAGLGTPHTFETEAIFGPGNAVSIEGDFNGAGESYSTYNAPIVPVVQGYWISFVKSLNPNPYRASSAPVWRPFGSGIGDRIRIKTNDTAMEVVTRGEITRCALWDSLQVAPPS